MLRETGRRPTFQVFLSFRATTPRVSPPARTLPSRRKVELIRILFPVEGTLSLRDEGEWGHSCQ